MAKRRQRSGAGAGGVDRATQRPPAKPASSRVRRDASQAAARRKASQQNLQGNLATARPDANPPSSPNPAPPAKSTSRRSGQRSGQTVPDPAFTQEASPPEAIGQSPTSSQDPLTQATSGQAASGQAASGQAASGQAASGQAAFGQPDAIGPGENPAAAKPATAEPTAQRSPVTPAPSNPAATKPAPSQPSSSQPSSSQPPSQAKGKVDRKPQPGGRLVWNHSTHLDGLIPKLERLCQKPGITTVTPAVLGRTRSHCPQMQIKVSVPILGGFKLIARQGKTFQEVFVLTELDREALEQLLRTVL